MFENFEDEKETILGTVILLGAGAVAGVLGKIGFDKATVMYKEYKTKKDETSEEAK